MVGGKVLGHSDLPLVSVGKQLLLVIEELLVSLSGELEVGTLHDGVHGACLLAEATVDALGHVNIISGGSATSVGTRLGLNSNCLKEITTSFQKLAFKRETEDIYQKKNGYQLCATNLSGANGFAQLAGNASLFTAGVTSEQMLSSESGRQRSFLERVVNGHLGPQCRLKSQP